MRKLLTISATFFLVVYGQVDFSLHGIWTNQISYDYRSGPFSVLGDSNCLFANLVDEKIDTCAIIKAENSPKSFFIFQSKVESVFGMNDRAGRTWNETNASYNNIFGPHRLYFANGNFKSQKLWMEYGRVKKLQYYLIRPVGVRGWKYNLRGASVVYSTNLLFPDRPGMDIFEIKKIQVYNPSIPNLEMLINLFIIDEIYPGQTHPDDVCISEINFQNHDGVFYYERGIPLAMSNK
ncbi:MAG: hypothetical protein J0L75_02630 [Spirochaetes bacterium]|nr:hypothetical protein [Spirochaetota bacterium]